MAREKEGYREMLLFLSVDKKLPALANKVQICEALGISRDYLDKLIAKGDISLSSNKVTIGSVARFLCS